MLRCVSHVGLVLDEELQRSEKKRKDLSPGQSTIIQFQSNSDQTGVHGVFIVENQCTSIARREMVFVDERGEVNELTGAFEDC